MAGIANAAPVYSARGEVGSNAWFGKRPGCFVAVAIYEHETDEVRWVSWYIGKQETRS